MNYAKFDHDTLRHHIRYKAFVAKHGLPCQECGGRGGETDPILDDGSGPFIECGYCEGTGMVTPHMRSLWLKWRKQNKAGTIQ